MKGPLIALGCFATLLILSLGMCGAGAASENDHTQSTLLAASLAGMAISVIGAFVSFVWLIVAIVRKK